MRLTPATIKRLATKPKRYDVTDDKLVGLVLAIYPPSKKKPNGVKSWSIRYTIKGKIWRKTIGLWPAINLETARRVARDNIREVEAGKNPQKDKTEARYRTKLGLDRDDKFLSVWDSYIKNHVAPHTRPTTSKEIQRVGKKLLLPVLGKRDLRTITPREVKAVLDNIKKKAPITANRVRGMLLTFWNWAVAEFIATENPVEKTNKPTPTETKRKRVLSDIQLRHLWAACVQVEWPFGDLVRVLMLTGCRRGEISKLEWDWIDGAANTITIPPEATKNARSHVVHITKMLGTILDDIPVRGRYVFSARSRPPSGYSKAKRRIDTELKKIMAGEFEAFEPWTFHDVRRSVASGLSRLRDEHGRPKVELAVIEMVLNHRSGELGGLKEIYVQHNEADLTRAALELWSAHVAKIMA